MSKLTGGWVAGLTATLIREGINKRRAREIAQGYWEAYCKDAAEDEVDAERYRWLRDNRPHPMNHPNGDAWGMSEVIDVVLIYGDDLDAAIDEARGES